MKKIFSELEDLKKQYDTPIQIMEGLPFSQPKQIKVAEFYSNSRYLESNGANKDGLERDIPFFNIVNYRVTLAKVATDLDIKDVQITSDNPKHYVKSMLLQHEAYEWMKATNFSLFLNRLGYTRPKYGGVLVKKRMVKEKGKDQLELGVVQWKNATTNQKNISKGNKAECHYMSPLDLMDKKDAWDNVIDAVHYMTKNKKKYEEMEVYEIHGQFPKSVLNDAKDLESSNDDEYEYSMQRYFIGSLDKKEFVFLAEEYDQEDYKYLPWEEMSGRDLGRGVIEDSEQSQIWTNDAVQNERNAMELAGKVGVKTTNKKLGSSILEHDNGRIYEIDANDVFDSVNFAPTALGEFQTQIDRWNGQANLSTSSFDANTGEQPPANTPYSTTALLNQVASKPFDYRREEAGIFITEIFEDWVIPYLIKKLKENHILVSDYSEEELKMIDEAFATYEVNEKAKELILSGKIVTQEDYDQAVEGYKSLLQGTRRFLEIPDGFFDDIESKVTVVTTNEQRDKAATLTSLSEIMKTAIASFNPQTGKFGVLEDPILSKIFAQIVELSGAVSPVALGLGPKEESPMEAMQPMPDPNAVAPVQASPVQPQPLQPTLTQ
jgi:hypothetical protein